MSILLTFEEVRYGTSNLTPKVGETAEAFIFRGMDTVAKAQLKKVIDEAVSQHAISIKKGKVYGTNCDWFWQEIVKEIGEK